jgi:carbon monoxide dehydrogenase subunit G
MRILNDFTVEAPFDDVWDLLLDLDRVAPCVPGAQIDERVDDRAARGHFKVKLGPVTATYKGTIQIAEADRRTGDVVLRGEATETTASGTAAMVVRNRVADEDGVTRVSMDTDLKITGRAAQFGGRASLMQSVADRMVRDFAAALRSELAGNGTVPADDTSPRAASSPSGAPSTVPAGSPTEPPPSRPARAGEPLDAGSLLRGLLAERIEVVAAACLGAGFILGLFVARRAGGARG